MTLGPIPTRVDLTEQTGPGTKSAGNAVTSAWRAWLEQLYFFVKALGGQGTTAARPTMDLYIGMQYFDQTLGLPIWVQDLGPPVVWVDATGAPV